ncbi:holo-(acyl-carrier-protein) synthase [Vibrio nigripulchritudo MADA3029]|uniref:Holo-[acyl-carrier-protein] synthase n=2 Tax=Vibrio nigripulchritudo TaxID=28173 RepID=U4KC90_9VIBR|nr:MULTISPECIES: holo-ACP synthase [Vibrio]EGU60105.1 4'-phosphopantetheinyl transferase [Vibrio nigripulchritudo ATCC 27043]UAB70736.1 holo-ACP synthase [Vibrio sp. SCSIO 43132]CCN36161.1 holo-(acyl-carrier-protein) synthase [Vibrio nigripulchritudo AM115]CCN44796.1 holo-(acyl-carrier-protein) synthase [Vibrio nigripulchritudo FTn2]CCN50603.1 holo-(acyl-carrier-protein) synthase [Vibrio nigripulchritudo MADA3020]
MSIFGLGTDIAEIERFEKSLSRLGEAFAKRILTTIELSQYNSTKQQARFLAKRFAAKEAASKALGTGIAKGVTFHDFVITNDENGKPLLSLHNQALTYANENGVTQVHLSISDERHYAVATVIFER